MPISHHHHVRPLHPSFESSTAVTPAARGPHQLLERTFSFLDGADLLQARLVCRDFYQIIKSSPVLQKRLQSAPRPSPSEDIAMDCDIPSTPQMGPVPGFFQIAQSGRTGSVNLERVPPAGFWRSLAPFAEPVFEVVLKIPGRFSGHPVVRAPPGVQGVTLGMIADAFLGQAPWESWRGHRAEFFALWNAEEAAARLQAAYLREQPFASCELDAMDVEPCRPAMSFASPRALSMAMMCPN